MNILLQTGSWDFPKGGTDYFNKELAKALSKNHTVIIVSNRYTNENCQDHFEGNIHIYYFNPQSEPLSKNAFKFIKILYEKRKLIRELDKKYKIDIAMAGETELFALQPLKGRIIVRGGGLFYITTIKRFPNIFIKIGMKLYNNLTLKYAKASIALSNTEKEFFDKKAIPCRVIPHGVDIDLFKPMKNKKSGIVKLCYVGGLEPVKHPDVMMRLLNEIKGNFEFTWIGKGDVKINAKRMEVKNFDIPRVLANFDIFITTEMAWGVGKSTIEAAACGLPIVSLNYEKEKYGFFTESESEWLKKVEELIKSKKLRESEGKRNRNIVEKEYSKEKTYSSYEQELIKWSKK